MMKQTLLLLAVTAAFTDVKAEMLSPEALYYRCYAHFARTRPALNDARLLKIKAGTMTYVDACMELFDTASFDSSGILKVQTAESIKVLENFNRLHTSWFEDVSVLNNIAPGGENTNHFLHDGSEGALHFTRALFAPDGRYSDAITNPTSFRAERDKGYNYYSIWPTIQKLSNKYGSKDASIAVGNSALPNFATAQQFPLSTILDPTGTTNGQFLQVGKLIGVVPLPNLMINNAFHCRNDLPASCPKEWPAYTNTNKANLTKSFGSGVIGTQPYLLINKIRNALVMEDGGIRTPRVWGKQVFKEILCRDIPVVQPKDVLSLVDPMGTNAFPFRNAASCMQCHSSIDPLGWTVRDLRLNKLGNDPGTNFGNVLYFMEQHLPTNVDATKPADYVTEGNVVKSGKVFNLGASGHRTSVRGPAETDAQDLATATTEMNLEGANFYKRPPKGHFYFRTYDGKLISENLDGLKGPESVGEVISGLDDYYACGAKRYLEFLTGHKVIWEDITSPQSTVLNRKEAKLRDFVISLGKKLHQDQKTREVIKSIISSDIYKDSNFEISY